jgi:hypothetical protein
MNHFRTLSGMRILIIDTNNVDFMEKEDDYRSFLEIIHQDYPPGIHRVLL